MSQLNDLIDPDGRVHPIKDFETLRGNSLKVSPETMSPLMQNSVNGFIWVHAKVSCRFPTLVSQPFQVWVPDMKAHETHSCYGSMHGDSNFTSKNGIVQKP